jgi:glutaredoxin 2
MATLQIPKVIQFALSEFKVDIAENKWTAKRNICGEKRTKTRGTTTGFTKNFSRRHSYVYEAYAKSKQGT